MTNNAIVVVIFTLMYLFSQASTYNSMTTDALAQYQSDLNQKTICFLYDDQEIRTNANEMGLTVSYGDDHETLVASWDKNVVSNLIGTVHKNDCQNDVYDILEDEIVITKGHDGRAVDYNELNAQIEKAITNQKDYIEINVPFRVEKPVIINFDALYDSVHVEMTNASYSKKDGYIREQTGVSFDKKKATKEYELLKSDEKMIIPLIKEEPKIKTEDLSSVLFTDEIASFKTYYSTQNTARQTNLQLASNSINGVILKPREKMSFNKTVGALTAERGYLEAKSGTTTEIGGGIDQLTSTLYNAVLKADLEVTERKGHSYFPEFVNPSFDAIVTWGSVDFEFKNNRETPIIVYASAKGGVLSVSINGIKKENEPEISLEYEVLEKYQPITRILKDSAMFRGESKVTQTGVQGYKSEGYKVYKDSQGNEIKREKISTDIYRALDKIIVEGTK